MNREELIRKLNGNFPLDHWQEEGRGGKGYRLRLRLPWYFSGLDVSGIRVQLMGIDPLTGEDVAAEDITATFTFDQKEYESDSLLTYHGKFCLKCTAILNDGESVDFREKPIELDYPENRPEILYSVRERYGFREIQIRSNCWNNCRGKVWITVDGHDQRINIPAGSDKTVHFYVSAEGGPIEIKVRNEDIRIREER